MNKFRIFLYDLKRALTEKSFWFAVFAGVFILIISFLYYVILGDVTSSDTLFKMSQALAFPFAAPLLCCIPYSSMQMLEEDTGYKILMSVKIRRTSYSFPRFFVCGIAGALAMFIPQMILYITAAFFGGYTNAECISGVMLGILFGFAYSTIAYSLTFFSRKRYIPTVFPQVIYMLCIYAFPHLNLEKFYPPLAISPWIYGSENYVNMIYLLAAIIVIAIFLCIIGAMFSKMIKYSSN